MKKSTQIAHMHHKMRTVSLFGTGLFVAAVALQALAVGATFFYMKSLGLPGLFSSFATIIITMLAGIVVPMIAYFLGDRSTKSRSPYEHYYNGILFAFMTLGLILLIGLIIAVVHPDFSVVISTGSVAEFTPAVISLLIAAGVGYMYSKKRHQHRLDEYPLFQAMLVLPVLVMATLTVVSILGTLFNPALPANLAQLLPPLLFAFLTLTIPLFLSDRSTMVGRMVEMCIALWVAAAAVLVFSQIPLNGFGDDARAGLPFILGLLVWLAYLYYYYYRKV